MAGFAWPSIAVIAVLVVVFLALAVGPGTARASGDLSESACRLIHHSGVLAEALGGHSPELIVKGGDTCDRGACWQRIPDPKDPAQTICHYARGIDLSLEIAPTAKRAREIVNNNFRTGAFVRVKHKGAADVMISLLRASKSLVIFAVGRRIAYFALKASSDDDPSASWEAAAPAGEGARKIAAALRKHPGCPKHLGDCPE